MHDAASQYAHGTIRWDETHPFSSVSTYIHRSFGCVVAMTGDAASLSSHGHAKGRVDEGRVARVRRIVVVGSSISCRIVVSRSRGVSGRRRGVGRSGGRP